MAGPSRRGRSFLRWVGVALLAGVASFAHAQTPGTINYHGYLTNSAGVPLNGPQAMGFALYDDPSAGTLLWAETQTLSVAKGLFDAVLGTGSLVAGVPLGNLPFDRPYYLAVSVGPETLGPRQPLTSTPYARRAAVADAVNASAPLVIGSNTTANCDAAHAGALRWNAALPGMQLCDGVAWRAMSVGPQTFAVGGTVTGLSGTLQLQNNGSTITLSADGPFTFPVPVASGSTYAVSVQTGPSGQICSVANGAGTMGSANVTNVAVTCSALVPVLWYQFNNNGINSGSLPGYTMNFVGTTFAAGKVGQAISFGSGGYGLVSGMKATLGTYSQVTIAFWYYESTPVTGQAFLDDSNRSLAPYGGVQLGQSAGNISVCVSTTTSSFLSGGCNGFTAPSAGAWHHYLVRYSGTGTGTGQGGVTEVYVDGVLALTRANDANNNPVFTSAGIPDTMSIAGNGALMDDFKIFNRTFTQAEQCVAVIGGTWTGTACTLP